MASEVSICNEALQEIGAGRIVSLAQDSVEARACNAIYSETRDQLLREYAWSFAIKRAQLAASATDPAFGPSNAYPLPSDCLRVLLPEDADLDWVIEGREILTDWGAPLEIRYIRRVTDPNTMDVLFRRALAGELGMKLAEPLTQSTSKWEKAKDIRDEAIAKAKRTNAIEKLPVEPREDTWITARI